MIMLRLFSLVRSANAYRNTGGNLEVHFRRTGCKAVKTVAGAAQWSESGSLSGQPSPASVARRRHTARTLHFNEKGGLGLAAA